MARNGINYFYTGVLGLNQDSLKVFYDFNSGDANHILSVPIGNAEHSGEILGNSGEFFGDMSSGNFYNNGVKIANSTGLFSQNATFIVTQEKTGINGGTIFSNFEGSNFKSGYHFGINDANKFYWGYQDDQNPIIKTSLTTLSDKNAFAVKLEENNVSFCYYNNNTLQFEKSSWGINSDTLLPSDQWFVGTGKNLKPYDHIIDNFIYVDRALPDSSLIRLFSGLWNESSGNFSGYLPYETGQITGYTNVITGVTGILNTTQQFSGNFTGESQVEVYQFVPQTGVIIEGGKELVFLQNLPQFCTNRDEQPIYWEKDVAVESTGITGLEKVFSGFQTVNQVTPIYNEIIETGFISSGEVLAPLYNTGNANDIISSGSISNIPDIPYLNSFGMKSVSYLGGANGLDYFDVIGAGSDQFNGRYFRSKDNIGDLPHYAKYDASGINEVYHIFSSTSLTGRQWYMDINTGAGVTAYSTNLIPAVEFPPETGWRIGDFDTGVTPPPKLYRKRGDFFESLSVTGNPLQNYFNKIATYNFSNLTFQTDATYNSGHVDVFSNGLIQSTGGYAITGEFFDQGVLIFDDYYISGRNIFFSVNDRSSEVVYDTNNSGDKFYTGRQSVVFYNGEPVLYSGQLVYYGSGIDYSSSGTLDLDVDSNLFFFNGEKLISGIDYTGLNNLFAPSSEITGSNGELRTLEIRPNQNYLNNILQSNRYNFSFSADFISGTTGINPSFEIISGIYDGDLNTPDLFTGASGQFTLDTGVYPTGFYETETGIVTFPSYTGWQIYSGSDIYDIRVGIEPLPPTNGWQNGTEFLLGWKPDGVVGQMTGQTFLRDTSINWLNGVRLGREFLEHGSVDLLNGNQISKGGLSGFFSNNTDFWN